MLALVCSLEVCATARGGTFASVPSGISASSFSVCVQPLPRMRTRRCALIRLAVSLLADVYRPSFLAGVLVGYVSLITLCLSSGRSLSAVAFRPCMWTSAA